MQGSIKFINNKYYWKCFNLLYRITAIRFSIEEANDYLKYFPDEGVADEIGNAIIIAKIDDIELEKKKEEAYLKLIKQYHFSIPNDGPETKWTIQIDNIDGKYQAIATYKETAVKGPLYNNFVSALNSAHYKCFFDLK